MKKPDNHYVMKRIASIIGVFSFVVFLIPEVSVRAEDTESLKEWSEFIGRGQVGEIATAFSRREAKWHRLDSVENPSFREENDRIWVDLAKDLVAILRQNVARVRRGGNDLEAAKDYLAIEMGLRKADGYTNLLVANAYAQMAGISLTKALVDKPGLAETIQEILASRKARGELDIRSFFLDYIDDDPLLKNNVDYIKSLKEDMSLFEAGIEIQRGIPEFGTLEFPENTLELIERPAIGRLFTEIAAGEMTLTALLPGLAEFYRRGGKEADLDRGNARPFEQIMGDVKRDHSYPLFQMRYLDVTRLLNLIEMSRDTRSRELLDKKILN